MRDGIIQQIGGPLELYNNPVNKFVAGFYRVSADEFSGHGVKYFREQFCT